MLTVCVGCCVYECVGVTVWIHSITVACQYVCECETVTVSVYGVSVCVVCVGVCVSVSVYCICVSEF